MGCPFAPLGVMFSVIYNFRGLHPVRCCVVVSSVTLEKLVNFHYVSCLISVI